jgi:multisubunit Na+/H+ antiporter MnhB subunit
MVFMIIAAIAAIEIKDLISSVVALGAVGLGLSITFLVLKAPELAIMQLVVEILALVILIRATLKVDLPFSASGRWLINTVITVLFIGGLIVAASKCFNELPPFGEPIMRVASAYLKEGLKEVGAVNLVSSITLDYRAYDTLGEASILFAAVIGVFVIARHRGKKKIEEHDKETDEQ